MAAPASVTETPVVLGRVKFSGLGQTRASVIDEELVAARAADTLGELHAALDVAAGKLRHTQVFDGVQLVLDAGEKPGLVDLQVKLRERQRLGLSVGTYTSERNALQGELQGEVRNPLGFADFLRGTYKTSLKGTTYGIGYVKPRILGEPLRLEVDAREDIADYEYVASHRQRLRGLALGVATHDGRHRAQYRFDLRDASPRTVEATAPAGALGAAAPTSAYQNAVSREMLRETERGTSDKSSLTYTFTDDRRNNRVCPTQGSFLCSTAELAGLTGDARFIKGLVDLQHSIPLLAAPIAGAAPFAFSLGASFGLVKPFDHIKDLVGIPSTAAGGSKLRIFDRLQAGGPTHIRGFEYQGIGPRAAGGSRTGDSLGGDVSWRCMAALSGPLPIPRLAENGVRLQAFANAGNLVNWAELKSRGRVDLMPLVQRTRASAGVGAYLSLGGMARLEVNYSWILRAEPGDVQRNLQFGLSVHI